MPGHDGARRRNSAASTMTFPGFDKAAFVKADRTRLKQIVINLLSNAIKYNKQQGTVVVECVTNNPERTRISVSDTGAGLSPEKLAQLFQPFNRLGQEAGGVAGTGIGLVVTKRLAELMEGALGVDSIVGKGSVFWCDLPFEHRAALRPRTSRRRGPRRSASADRGGDAHGAVCRGQPGEHDSGRATHRQAARHPSHDRGERNIGHRG